MVTKKKKVQYCVWCAWYKWRNEKKNLNSLIFHNAQPTSPSTVRMKNKSVAILLTLPNIHFITFLTAATPWPFSSPHTGVPQQQEGWVRAAPPHEISPVMLSVTSTGDVPLEHPSTSNTPQHSSPRPPKLPRRPQMPIPRSHNLPVVNKGAEGVLRG